MTFLRRLLQRTPMSTPTRHAIGSLLAMWGRTMLLVGLGAAAFGMLVGEFSSVTSIDRARADWREEGKLADVEVMFSDTPVTSLNSEQFEHFGEVVFRSRQYGSVRLDDQTQLAATIVVQEVSPRVAQVNRLIVLEGAFPADDTADEVVIDAGSAKENQIEVGDQIAVVTPGKERLVRVAAIALDPEFLVSMANPSLFVPAKGSMVIIHLSEPFGSDSAVNSVVIRNAEGQVSEGSRAVIEEAIRGSGANEVFSISQSEQLGQVYLDKNLSVFRILIPAMVVVAYLAAAFVTAYLSAQWMMSERTAVALLLVQGYRPKRVVRSYLITFAVMGVLTVGVGMVWAWSIGSVFLETFASGLGMPTPEFTFDRIWVGLGALATAGLFGLGIAMGLFSTIGVTPLEALRDRARGPRRQNGRERASIQSSTPSLLSLRSLRSHRLVTLSTVVAMALGFGMTSGLVLTYFSVMDGAGTAVARNNWDAMADFSTPIDHDVARQTMLDAGASDASLLVKGVAQIEHENERTNLSVGGFEADKLWQIVEILDGTDISTDAPDNGVILESTTAAEIGLSVGDDFQMLNGAKSYGARVIGIMSSPLPGEARVGIAFAQRAFEQEGLVNAAFFQAEGSIDTVKQSLVSATSVQQVLDKGQILDLVVGGSEQLTGILWIGSFMGAVVSFLFLASCLGYLIVQRSRDYAMARVLGFTVWQLRFSIISETTFLGAVATLLAVPIAWGFGTFLTAEISRAWFAVDLVADVNAMMVTLGPNLLLLPIMGAGIAAFALRGNVSTASRTRSILS